MKGVKRLLILTMGIVVDLILGVLVATISFGAKIVSVEQLRGYTDLLEGITILMRRHVSETGGENSRAYRKIFGDSGSYSERICATDCLALPKGTTIFEVHIPMFQLQLAEIKGKLKVISVMDESHTGGK